MISQLVAELLGCAVLWLQGTSRVCWNSTACAGEVAHCSGSVDLILNRVLLKLSEVTISRSDYRIQ